MLSVNSNLGRFIEIMQTKATDNDWGEGNIVYLLPLPSSPRKLPQPPQLAVDPSGLRRRQLEPVPEMSTMPPMEKAVNMLPIVSLETA